MAVYKAVITSASEVEINGTQSAAFDIKVDGVTKASGSITEDVDVIADAIHAIVDNFQIKYESANNLNEGAEIVG